MQSPESLSNDQIAKILNDADVIETWLKAVREYAKEIIEAGESVPGWKVQPKRGIRKWKDIRMVKQRLASEGLNDFLVEEVASPAAEFVRFGLLGDIDDDHRGRDGVGHLDEGLVELAGELEGVVVPGLKREGSHERRAGQGERREGVLERLHFVLSADDRLVGFDGESAKLFKIPGILYVAS